MRLCVAFHSWQRLAQPGPPKSGQGVR